MEGKPEYGRLLIIGAGVALALGLVLMTGFVIAQISSEAMAVSTRTVVDCNRAAYDAATIGFERAYHAWQTWAPSVGFGTDPVSIIKPPEPTFSDFLDTTGCDGTGPFFKGFWGSIIQRVTTSVNVLGH